MVERDPGSFRDPSAYIVRSEGRIFRVLDDVARERFLALKGSGVVDALIQSEAIWPVSEIADPPFDSNGGFVVEHPVLPFVSYPYEWSFPLLKRAALHHIDVHLAALEHDATLIDATAYNIQFCGVRASFIDTPSLRPYVDGEFWMGQQQFAQQFLNPLLLMAHTGIPFNAWYRGSLEGISSADLNALIPFRKKISFSMLENVVLPASFQRAAQKNQTKVSQKAKRASSRKLPKTALIGMLSRLRRWIEKLEIQQRGVTAWQNYDVDNSYASDEENRKHAFVAAFANECQPKTVFDLGCNTGAYSETALSNGAQRVVGFDADHVALEKAFARADAKGLDFLPLYMDAANPSPDQGWGQRERQGLATRSQADAILALAFEHHLAIGRNIPLPALIDWMVGIAPRGVIEFVPKSDPMIERMLEFREDIFSSYSQAEFETQLGSRATIVRQETVSETGRTLYQFERR